MLAPMRRSIGMAVVMLVAGALVATGAIALAAPASSTPANPTDPAGPASAAAAEGGDADQQALPATAPDARAAGDRVDRTLVDAGTDVGDGVDLTEIAPLPKVSAKAFAIQDAATDELLASLDAAKPRPIASLTKLMTALVVTERTQPDDIVTVPAEAAAIGIDAASMGLQTGEKWKVEDLLQTMLVSSANDAAIALAMHVGDGSQEDFIQLMNDRAEELDLTDTTYTSVSGLDEPGKLTTSTPLDLVSLAQIAFQEPRIKGAVRRQQLVLQRPGSAPGDADATIKLENRNPLLGSYAGVDGIKTGFTDSAGYMLLLHHADKIGNDLFVATADSRTEAARASDGAALLDWARPLRQRLLAVEGGTSLGTVPVLRSGRSIRVFACDDAYVVGRVGQQLEQVVSVPRAVAPPIARGQEIGDLTVRVAGTPGATVPVCSNDAISAEGWQGRLRLYLSEYDTAWNEGVEYVTGEIREPAA